MADDVVSSLQGIGPVTSQTLKAAGIGTVNDLIQLQERVSDIPNITTLVERAKKHIQTHTVVEDESDCQTDAALRLMIEDHTWWEQPVFIPVTPVQTKKAIVYEMVLDPNERIALLCSWVSDAGEELCSSTYSPMMLKHFNQGTLPILRITVRPTDWNTIINRDTVANVLWETNMMHHAV